MLPQEDTPERRIFLDALLTYADSCAMPALTPTCPFYVMAASGPTCLEQCRDILRQSGGLDRPVLTGVTVGGGLKMSGRALPLSVAGGPDSFDAREAFLKERVLPVTAQSTGTLMLSLRAAIVSIAVRPDSHSAARAVSVHAELARRGLPVTRVILGGVVPELSKATMAMVVMARVSAPDPEKSAMDARMLSWMTAVEALADSFGTPDEAMAQAMKSIRNQSFGRHARPTSNLDPLATFERQFQNDVQSDVDLTPVAERVLLDAVAQVAMSEEFLGRIQDWFCRVVNRDFRDLFNSAPPPPEVFLALASVTDQPDEVGRWLYQRFTVTDLADWDDSSLVLECRTDQDWEAESASGLTLSDLPCPPNVRAERRLDQGAVAKLALSRVTRSAGRPKRGYKSLEAGDFVASASAHIRSGEFKRAADIFTGLVEYSPKDGTALNNLGFCMMALDPHKALYDLERASLLPLRDRTPNVANRVLALHLLDRDREALLLTAMPDIIRDEARGAILWKHSGPDRSMPTELVSTDSVSYLEKLAHHIRSDSCRTSS